MDARILTDIVAIKRRIYRFMQSFDDKDWQTMRTCLHESVHCDHSSFRGTPAAVTAADDYVAQRRSSLSDLGTQHNIHNVDVGVDGDLAKVRCNYVIYRFLLDSGRGDPEHFHSYGHYEFTLCREAGEWKIDRIAQHLLASHGNRAIHGAFRASNEKGR